MKPWEAFQSGDGQGPWNAFVPSPDVVIGKNGEPTRLTVRPAKPDVGQGAALGRGTAQGVTMGLSDEMVGASAASGVHEMLAGLNGEERGILTRILGKVIDTPARVASPSIGALRMLYEQLSGQNDPSLSSGITGEQPKGEATKTYEKTRDAEREANKTAQEQYPGTYLTGQIGGSVASGLAVPGGAAVQGATLPARMGTGAVAGGLTGALTGFGEGEGLKDSAIHAGTGAAVGTLLGGIAPPIVEGIVQGGRTIAAPVINAVRGAFNPQGEASRRVVGAIERDIRTDPNAATRLTPQEFAASAQSGGPATVMDMGGGLTRRLADSAAITSPEGGNILNQTINNRFEGQASRVTDWLRNTFNFPNAHAQQQALDQTQRTVNRGAYARAYREGDRGLWSDELERLTSSPDIVDAMRTAATQGKSRAVTQGFGGFNPGVTVDNGGIVTFQRGANGQPTFPNLQFWDYTKRALDDAANAARRGGRNEEASTLGALSRQLRGELDTLVPSYAEARAGAARFFGAENALEAGQNFVTAKLGNREARDTLARMTPQERQLFQDGFVSRFTEILNSTADRRSVLNKIAESPEAREKLNMVLGQQRAAELEGGLRVEGIMDLARQAVQGNSWTTRRLYDLGLAGGAGVGGIGTYNMDPQAMTYGAVIAAISTGGKKIDQRVAQRVAQLLTSNDPAQLQLGVTLVARSERMLENLRSVDRRIIAAGSPQAAGSMPSLQGPVRASAEGEQQGAPGGVNQQPGAY